MTIKEIQEWGISELKKNKVDQPASSASFLLRQILNVEKTYLVSYPDEKINLLKERKYKGWIGRRLKHEPVWYITGKIEFFGQDFYVSKNALIPRPETELLVEKVLTSSQQLKVNSRILDMGTGSGAIILTLVNQLESRKQLTVNKRANSQKLMTNDYCASDISSKALAVAKKNAKNLGLGGKIKFKKGDLFAPWLGQKFDLIVANLPYIPHEEMPSLSFDLIHYEPRVALDGGEEGLEVYDRFFRELPFFLNPKASIFCEIGIDQGKEIKKIIKRPFPKAKINILGDYASIDRIAIIRT
jgi:release factor glutamine methyltransferase